MPRGTDCCISILYIHVAWTAESSNGATGAGAGVPAARGGIKLSETLLLRWLKVPEQYIWKRLGIGASRTYEKAC